MPDYTGTARSNAFRVKDTDAFIEGLNEVPDILVERTPQGQVIIYETWGCGWPKDIYARTDEDIEFDMIDYIIPHLADNEVAVFIEAGAAEFYLLLGSAVAVNNKGEIRSIHLGNIFDLAKELGPNVTVF